jgi:hypothetical protein
MSSKDRNFEVGGSEGGASVAGGGSAGGGQRGGLTGQGVVVAVDGVGAAPLEDVEGVGLDAGVNGGDAGAEVPGEELALETRGPLAAVAFAGEPEDAVAIEQAPESGEGVAEAESRCRRPGGCGSRRVRGLSEKGADPRGRQPRSALGL